MSGLVERVKNGINRRVRHAAQNARLLGYSKQVWEAEQAREASQTPGQRPVIFFNASTRLDALSLNAGFSLVTAWALRLQGVPVLHFVCNQGMSHCVLGTERDDPDRKPPCQVCMAQSRVTYANSDVTWFERQPEPALEKMLDGKGIHALERVEYQGMPLGKLALPSLRWILRRHHLIDDEKTRYFFRQYIFSAWSIARQFKELLARSRPQAVVVFNGMFYPEAAARWVAAHHNPPVKVISHEVGLRPFSGFFTTGDATAYPIDLPESFQLTPAQNEVLDTYLEKRRSGNFSMAGVRFWPQMSGMGEDFWAHAAKFKQLVPIFTNVIFDTSQGQANVIFEDMFNWLDELLNVIRAHPQTLFVLRAHPDESRPGKQALESVAGWVEKTGADKLPNVVFIPSEKYFSSYELIEKAKFVLIYNSTIGLEASIMGAAVLCAGKSRFTQLPTVFFPADKGEYQRTLEDLLDAETIRVPEEFRLNARRFLYAQIFRTSLLFDQFLEEDGVWRGYVALKDFKLDDLRPEKSETVKVLLEGILQKGDFLLDA
jgi:hypothetical protein